MDARDFPFLGDPGRAIGLASFRYTEDEFAAAHRAGRIATVPWYRSWPWALAFFGPWHAGLAWGLYAGFVAPRAAGRTPPVDAWGGVLAFTSGLVLWTLLYGLERRVRSAYRKFPLAGEDYAVAFTADRFMGRTPLSDFSDDWSFLRRVVELRDGFVLVLKVGGSLWLPDHALVAPFDHRAAAELFRSKVPKYLVVNRSARRGASGAVPAPG